MGIASDDAGGGTPSWSMGYHQKMLQINFLYFKTNLILFGENMDPIVLERIYLVLIIQNSQDSKIV